MSAIGTAASLPPHDVAVRHMLAEAAYREARQALDAAGVAHLVLKGPHLAATVYDPPWERSINDLDLLIAPRDLNRAWGALLERGFRRTGPNTDDPGRTYDPTLLAKSGWHVEVHHALAPHNAYAIDVDELFARAEPFLFGREATRGLAPEDLLLHLVVHAAKSHFRVILPKHLEDVARLVRRRPLHWASVVERAQRWGCATAAWIMLSATVEAEGAQVPGEVLAALAPSRRRQWWIQRFVSLDGFPLLRYQGVPRSLMRVAMAPAMVDDLGDGLQLAARLVSKRLHDLRHEQRKA